MGGVLLHVRPPSVDSFSRRVLLSQHGFQIAHESATGFTQRRLLELLRPDERHRGETGDRTNGLLGPWAAHVVADFVIYTMVGAMVCAR